MGARTDQAERAVVQQRERISRMVSDLEQRASEDVRAAGNRISERASELQSRASNAVDSVPGKHVVDEQVPRHPLSSVIGGFGAGVVIGMLSGGPDGRNGQRSQARQEPEQRSRQQDSNGGGLFDAVSAAAMTSIAAPLQQELKGIAKQAVDGFLGKTTKDSASSASDSTDLSTSGQPGGDAAEPPREAGPEAAA